MIDGQRYWRVPVMDGEFVAQETTAVVKGVGGGNLLLLARDTDAALAAAEAAVAAMKQLPNVDHAVPRRRGALGLQGRQQVPGAERLDQRRLLPDPASAWRRRRELTPETRCVMEIVIDGLTEADVGAAMRAGMQAGIALGAAGGLLRISAGNYGGKLGPFHFHLHKLLAEGAVAGMSGWTLQAEAGAAAAVDLRGITPVGAGRRCRAAEVERLRDRPWQRASLPLAEFFAVAPRDRRRRCVFDGDLSRCDRIGWQMAGGRIRRRRPGRRLRSAPRMSGGELHRAAATPALLAACEMAGGTLAHRRQRRRLRGQHPARQHGRHARRHADRRAATPARASATACGAARRWCSATRATSSPRAWWPARSPWPARAGAHAGYGMRRGSVVFAGPAPARIRRPSCRRWPMRRVLATAGARPGAPRRRRSPTWPRARIERHLGDLAAGGKGELILAVSSAVVACAT